jgi:hypothetical protein
MEVAEISFASAINSVTGELVTGELCRVSEMNAENVTSDALTGKGEIDWFIVPS